MIGLLFLFWLAVIISVFGWFCFELYGLTHVPKNIKKWGRLLSSAAAMTLVTWPMLGQSIKDELGCKFAGLEVSKPIDARNEGLFWQSVTPNANAYSMGFVHNSDYNGHMMMATIRRALLEGRFSYLEFPAGPKNYQRVFLAKTRGLDYSNTHCFNDMKGENVGPENWPQICVAYEEVSKISSKYELITSYYDNYHLKGVKIIDRTKFISNVIAKYARGFKNSSQMIPALATPSCTLDKLDDMPLFSLVIMQFSDSFGKVSSRKELVKFEDLNWSPADLNNVRPYR